MNRTPVPIKVKKCSKCGGDWDLEACYRKNQQRGAVLGALSTRDYHPTCVMCELTERNDPTPEQRAHRKAENCIALHAQKYGMEPKEFARRYDWDVARMKYDILHGYENTCHYCWERYGAMGHGLSDITLDIVDPKAEPYYRTNARWCCQTCNREKSAMPPDLWARRLAAWPRHMKWREGIRNEPTFGLPLFAHRALLMLVIAVGALIAW